MNYKILLIFFLLFLSSCIKEFNADENVKFKFDKKYKNSGFALIYSDNLKISEKLDNTSLFIFHKSLEKKSFVKITNPLNEKSLIAEVIKNTVNFSDFYNSVITERIMNELELNQNEPLIEINLISPNSTFIAKKVEIFDEEKKIAEKAPVDIIQTSGFQILNNKTKKSEKKNFSYSIKIAEFYYFNSAQDTMDAINKKINLKNMKIVKLSDTRFILFLGPFNDIKILEDAFIKMKSLNFENLEILKNV
ncbi:MAG: hypothetical protein EXR14_03415 [Pelagibacteraceae bacterium]|nr:hypothetical protein [Pelagibacteraceae bacterium]PHX88723.1 MAG: hypothetical protein CK535_05355 [Pelagibacteraceae bacterium]